MIPIYLRVSNFLCYRETALSFDGLHLACLVGDNGAGKSALLDAMTWAVWGKARSHLDNALVHLGQEQMEVEFHFQFGPNRYRIVRKRSRAKSGQSQLALWVWSDAQDDWRDLSETGLRQTEAAIAGILRLDFDTFLNSAYLRQGNADAFTTATPMNRKQILANILNLGRYDEYADRAKRRARACENEANGLRGRLHQIDEELAHEADYRQQVEQAEAELREGAALAREGAARVEAFRAQRHQLESQKQTLDDLRARLADAAREVQDVQTEIAARRQRLAGFDALLAQRAAIETGYQQWQAARQHDEALNATYRQHSQLARQQDRLEQAIEAERRHLLLQLQARQKEQDDLHRRLADKPAQEQALADASTKLAELGQVEQTLGETRQRLAEMAEERATLAAQGQQVQAEGTTLKERLALVEEVADAACPVCRQPLRAHDRARLADEMNAELADKRARYKTIKANIEALAAQETALRATEKGLDVQLRARAQHQAAAARAEQALAAIAEAATRAAALAREIAELERTLRAEAFAAEPRVELQRVAKQLAELAYDEAAHEQVRQSVSALKVWEEQHAALQLAAQQADSERDALGKAAARLERLEAAAVRDGERAAALQAEVARLPEVVAALAEHQRKAETLAEQESRARERLAAARQRVDACLELAKQKAQHEAQIRALAEQTSLYEELQAAFGKKGLQAMIIDAALPDIEAEANRLLGRMTEGRMNVRLETQRESQKGDTIETLEVLISDEWGQRGYEMYSGGEAFRVNFALRIALSKLLAHRSGARLETLIIDEGFGTQDAQGRQSLVDAINRISDEFERILVVTHLDELKNLFPAHILVTKSNDGSTVNVVT